MPNRGSPPAVLLRESYREGGKVKNRTLANLSHWPAEKVEALRAVLKGEAVLGPAERALVDAFEVTRSLPHGHVAAVVGTLRRLGLEELIGPALASATSSSPRARSPRRPAWTASTCLARACPKRSSAQTGSSFLIRSSRTWSERSGASVPS